jgi:exo-beta-1,3-glucanase (GH17 family)
MLAIHSWHSGCRPPGALSIHSQRFSDANASGTYPSTNQLEAKRQVLQNAINHVYVFDFDFSQLTTDKDRLYLRSAW